MTEKASKDDYLIDSMVKYATDDELFFRDCLKIRDHDTSMILPFKMNRAQRILHNVIEKQNKEIGRVRALVLKARRKGISTYIEGRYYKNTSTQFNKNAFIVGHEEESTKTLFGMSRLFQEKNPIAPAQLSSNAQELIFDNKKGTGLKSGYRLATARNTGAGRSQGIHYLHLSEEAFYPTNAKELLLGLLQCVPDQDSEIVRESTPNGYGNTFQEQAFKSYADGEHPFYEEDGITYAWGAPDTDWIIVFLPWFISEKYKMKIPKNQVNDFSNFIDQKVFDVDDKKWVQSEEKTLKDKFNLTYEQLYWRRWAIENKCGGSKNRFRQEYPSTFHDGFLSKGSNVFTRQLCDELEEQIKDPITVGDVYRSTGKTRIKRNKHGAFTIWEHVNTADSYFLTVDVAGGLEPAGAKVDKEPDKTCIDVWNHRTGVQAAQWCGHMDYDMVGDLVDMIGELYAIRVGKKLDLPMACVELNNHGYTVVADLDKAQYPQYTNEKGGFGWQTNKRTKPIMIDNFTRGVRDSVLKINSLGTISEMRTYIEEGGKFGAAPGCNDDRVITGAIASVIIGEIPRKFNRKNASNAGFKNLESKPQYEDTYQEFFVA